MCVIIVKKQGVNVPTKKLLLQAYQANPHGCGFAVAKENGKTRMFKNLSFDKFYKEFADSVTKNDSAIIHFRLATHGSKSNANCHPFTNGKGLYFAHNGVLPIESKNDKTDSQILFDNVLAGAAQVYGIQSDNFLQIVDSVIGMSKFAFLDSRGVYTFGNFTESKGLLFSNTRGLYEIQPKVIYGNIDYSYRNDGFYGSLFAEHNQPYKRAKFSFK